VTAYAERTTVAPEKSRAEIERTLTRFGASHFMYAWSDEAAVIQFRMKAEHGYRQVKFILSLPDEQEYRLDGRGYLRSESARRAAHEQEIRRRWRTLALSIKAKLDAVQTGLFTFDEEFMPYLVLPDGRTVGEWMKPQIDDIYEQQQMPTEIRLALPRGDE